jgi:hypothetical protein
MARLDLVLHRSGVDRTDEEAQGETTRYIFQIMTSKLRRALFVAIWLGILGLIRGPYLDRA